MLCHLHACWHMSIPISTLEQLETLEDIWVQPIPLCTASDATTAEGMLRGCSWSLDCKVVSGNPSQCGVSSVELRVLLDLSHTQRCWTYAPPIDDISRRLNSRFEILLELITWALSDVSLLLDCLNGTLQKWTTIVIQWLWCWRVICVSISMEYKAECNIPWAALVVSVVDVVASFESIK